MSYHHADCDGSGSIYVGRRGANDPDVRAVECPECGGSGEVELEPYDDEEDA